MARICIIGGAGFIGRSLAAQLVAQQHSVVIPTRHREWAKRGLIMLPTVDLVEADVHDPAALTRLFAGCDAVINLIGVLQSKSGSPYGPGFAHAHVELPKKIIAACRQARVPRLIHIGALGSAADAPSEYLRSKADGEAAVMAAANDLHVTVFRPSVVFGRDDAFLNLFAGRLSPADPGDAGRQLMVFLQRFALFMPLPGATAKLQPVHVEDVAQAIVRSLEDDNAFGKTYTLVGPTVYTLEQLVRYAQSLAGRPIPILRLGARLGMVQAALLEFAPGKLMSRDNLRSLSAPNVSSEPFPFGIKPVTLEAVAPGYLAGVWPRSRYDRYRNRAGRHT